MIDLKPVVFQALRSNTELVDLLGGERISQIKADPEPDWQTWVTFFEIVNVDNNFSDDTAYTSDIRMQLDVWSRGNPQPAATEVNRTMESLGFIRTYAIDLYEEDTGIFHKAMRFKINKNIEEVS